jgi:glycosyltransferase involved in cell wall biosynthesis
MRVGLDLLFLVPGATGGTETYARELSARLAALPDLELVAFVSRSAAGANVAPGAREVTLPLDSRRRWQWALGEQVLLRRAAAAERCDVIHGLAGTVPLTGHFKRVASIHDAIFATYPEAHGRARALGFGALVRQSWKRSDAVLVDTPGAVTRLEAELGPRGPVTVVRLGPGVTPEAAEPAARMRDALGLGDRQVILSTAGTLAHKNVDRLLRAVALLTAPRPVTVFTGRASGNAPRLRDLAAELGIEDDVRFCGWVARERLEALYAAARLSVVASLDEGFGLPVLEAMARGCPVAHSGRGALTEVAGGAGATFDPEDPRSIAAVVALVLSDEATRARLIAAGHERARKHSWERTAQATAAVYRDVLGVARQRAVTSGGGIERARS